MNWKRRKEAKVASARRERPETALAALALLAALTAPALAGDRALIDLIGFSPDARYFAFEEFGIQDGSGFAYSSIYLLDLTNDSWVVGTPIRAQAADEERGLADTRAEAGRNAAAHLRDFDISVPVDVATMLGDGTPEIDGKTLRFGVPGYAPGQVMDKHHLQLRSFETGAANPCSEWFDSAPLGFELVLSDAETDTVIYRDGTLPRSRACPTDYRLYAVALPFMSQDIASGVAIVSYYPQGFEGPDRRFLAVPLAH